MPNILCSIVIVNDGENNGTEFHPHFLISTDIFHHHFKISPSIFDQTIKKSIKYTCLNKKSSNFALDKESTYKTIADYVK